MSDMLGEFCFPYMNKERGINTATKYPKTIPNYTLVSCPGIFANYTQVVAISIISF